MRRLFCALGLALALGAPARGTTYTVRPDGTGDFPTIDAAIVAVPEGSVIELSDGVFRGAGNRDLNYRGKAIVIRSASGDPARCVIDVENEPDHRGFLFWAAEDSLSVLEGVTVRGGRCDVGGGIGCWGGSAPRIARCVVSGNVATSEGYGGGGMFCTSSPIIEDCRFEGNSANIGGGIWLSSGGAPVLRRVSFVGNRAAGPGGAISSLFSGIDAVDCVFRANHADGLGGALSLDGAGHCTLTRCAFIENSATDAGAVSSWTNGATRFTGCTFAGNTATGRGGAIGCGGVMDYTLANCTFSANQAALGGALWIRPDAYPQLEQCILAFSPSGGAVFCEGVSVLPRFTCCDVYDNAGGDWIGCLDGEADLRGNISLDPLFCAGPTEDLHLAPESPCAPNVPPHPDCPLIGAWPVGCGASGIAVEADRVGLRLEPISPVPFGESVDLRFTVPAGAPAGLELTVHDASGRTVRTLLAGPCSPGAHRVAWDGRDASGRRLGAGIYFCRLRVGREHAGTRLVLIR